MLLSQKHLGVAAVIALFVPKGWSAGDAVSYNFQVRPVLTEHCFKCHGPDAKQRKAKLRLDIRESALEKKAFIPGDPDGSEIMKRLLTSDEDDLMPPAKEHRPMSLAEIEIVRKWIAEGAPYEKHWAFIPPVKPEPPEVTMPGAVIRNPIDQFVLLRLGKEKISPAAPAAREDWLRRVSFDLTGLPPTLAQIDAFLADESPDAFEKVVDRLLDSPAYGERMAGEWLDVARFADTYGRHEDDDCEMWPWRDWVVRAFNANLPYDKFLTWQTAGDMLPNATPDMVLATAFNRLPPLSDESGSDEEEFRQEIVADRVKTNGTALLGLSIGCARCHDHKYDPVTMRDFYSFGAFLNNIDELGLYSRFTDWTPAPTMLLYKDGQAAEHAKLKGRIAALEKEMAGMIPAAHARFESWLAAPHEEITLPKPLAELGFDSIGDDKVVANSADPAKPASIRLKVHKEKGFHGNGLHLVGDNSVSLPGVGDHTRAHPFTAAIWVKLGEIQKRAVLIHHSRSGLDAASCGSEVILEDGKLSFALAHFWPGNGMRVRAKEALPLNRWTHVTASYDGSSRAAGLRLYVNGEPVETEVVRDNLYKDIGYGTANDGKDNVENAHLGLGGRYNDVTLKNAVLDDFAFFDRELSAAEVEMLADAESDVLARPARWFDWWLREKDEAGKAKLAELHDAREAECAFAEGVREIMVMKEWKGERRPTFVLNRGRFDQPGERVEPDTPAAILPFPKDAPRNRLGLAQWLVDRKNPLTARVFVNRVWQMFFGRGIVLTAEDFGAQGQLPTHPHLLDWLATSFMDDGWNVKHLCRLIALSATYRQSSIPSAVNSLTNDPDNKLLARGPHQRLTAEQMRDNVLFVSGLLVEAPGGAPVKPYQAPGLWEESGTQHDYVQDHGDKLYRRSLYTFWRRTLPPPSMTTFDAPTREFCVARRECNASPMQALVIFNDTQFLEAARVFAENLVRQFPDDDAARVQAAYRTLTGKRTAAAACAAMTKLLEAERARFQAAPQEAESLRSKNGEHKPDVGLPAVEVAATTVLVRGLFAYDECVMKP